MAAHQATGAPVEWTCLRLLFEVLTKSSNQLAKNNLKGYNSIVEKCVPHYKLAVVQALVAVGKIRTTFAARQGALELGLDEHGICSVVEALFRAEKVVRILPAATSALTTASLQCGTAFSIIEL